MDYSNYEAFKTAIENCGIKAREAEFKKSTNVHTPYLCFFRSSERKVEADGETIYTIVKMFVELYTDVSDTASEKALEYWFHSQGISPDKTERAYVQEESYYETVYEFELIFDE